MADEKLLEELKSFLVIAKKNTYAAQGNEVEPERKGFKELLFTQGDFEYRDSYTGYFMAPGQEVVRYKGKPIWMMAYGGDVYSRDRDEVKKIYSFLKQALLLVEKDRPFRGPKYFVKGEYKYKDESEGTINNFKGTEVILHKGKIVFKQNYIGGLVEHKI